MRRRSLAVLAALFAVVLSSGSVELSGLALLIIVTMILVGFSEELMFRGVAFRGALNEVSPGKAILISSALFSLLHHGRVFLCTDVGDLGDFLRRFGLEALLLRERSAAAVVDALERLQRDPTAIAAALQAAQGASAWATTNAGIAAVYAGEG